MLVHTAATFAAHSSLHILLTQLLVPSFQPRDHASASICTCSNVLVLCEFPCDALDNLRQAPSCMPYCLGVREHVQ